MRQGAESKSLDILRVATDRYPDVMGGGALHVHEMSRMQAEMGHNIKVLTSDHSNRALPSVEQSEGYTVFRYNEWIRPFENSITPGMIPTLVRGVGDHDVIHAHSHLYFSTNLAASIARFTETPLVITNHGLFSQTAPRWIQRLYVPTVARFTLNSAERILCYTQTDRQRLRNRGIDAPISVIHNGIDCSMFRPLKNSSDSKQLLFVGRLKKSKGAHRLVEAFGGLVEKFPELSLKIVGNGPMRSEIEQNCKKAGVRDCVTFTGTVSNEELPRIYTESTLFVLPTQAEGLPRTVLESLACATPVVTSSLPQLKQLVDGVGRTVPAESIAELRAAITQLLRDSSLRVQMGNAGRERIVENYSWSETVGETTRIYYKLL